MGFELPHREKIQLEEPRQGSGRAGRQENVKVESPPSSVFPGTQFKDQRTGTNILEPSRDNH